MEPTIFYVGLYFLVSLLHLASSKVDGYGGWKNSPDTQYHIQTDEGEERYFKYQTKSGQYRKEKRLQDGTVVGTYGWVDPNGFLRLRDYVADNEGYRVVKTKLIYVGNNQLTDKTVAAVKNAPTKYPTLVPPSTAFIPNPLDIQSHRFAYIPPSTYHPAPPAYLINRQTTPFLPPETPYFPPTQTTYQGKDFFAYQSTPASTYLRKPGEPSPLLQFYPSSTPVVDVSPNSLPKSVPPLFASPTVSSPVISSSTPDFPSTTPTSVFLEAKSSSVAYSSTTPSPILSSTLAPPPAPTVVLSDPTPVAIYSSTPRPVAVNYASTPSPTAASATEGIRYIGETNTASPAPLLPPVSGKFLPTNNFITETEKNKLFFQSLGQNDYKKRYVDYQSNFQEYDGIATVQNGFRYFLPRQYQEEQSSPDGRERTGSFGYIDPFGIRRVIYYNTSPEGGFVHRKNNRYVGFDSTPYDPRP